MSDLSDAIARAKTWMRENDAGVLVDNLAPGASDETLARVEKELGMKLPADLRELWKIHDGQLEEMNGFIEAQDLISAEGSIQWHGTMQRRYVKSDFGILGAELHADEWKKVGLRPEEISEWWIVWAARDGDLLVVNADTGRVFRAMKDVPPLAFEADSITAWFQQYAGGMESGAFAVEEGFGDRYLQRG